MYTLSEAFNIFVYKSLTLNQMYFQLVHLLELQSFLLLVPIYCGGHVDYNDLSVGTGSRCFEGKKVAFLCREFHSRFEHLS